MMTLRSFTSQIFEGKKNKYWKYYCIIYYNKVIVFALLFSYIVSDYAKCAKGERGIKVVTRNYDLRVVYCSGRWCVIAFYESFVIEYTGCPRRNVPDFGRVFLMLNYTDITQNTYVQSRMVTEIMAKEKCGRHKCRNTVGRPWRHTCPMPLPEQRDMVMQLPWRVRYSTLALTSQFNISAVACVKYLEV